MVRAGQPTLARYENLTNVFLKLGETVPNLSDADFVPVERMLAVGVFDTVSSMGIPRPVVGGLARLRGFVVGRAGFTIFLVS